MERESIQNIGDLKIGDRFCFERDRKKGIVSEVTSKTRFSVQYKKEFGRGSCVLYKEVVFLRSTILNENS